MNNFFSLLGSIASIIAIPLAIYFYLKQKEAKNDKVRKEITKILSYQIGESRELTTFEIQAVINSKLRENKIRSDSILVSETIEDLIAETMASPLLDEKRKEIILDNLKRLYNKGELYEAVEKFDVKQIKTNNEFELTLEERIKELVETRKQVENDLQISNVKKIELQEKYSSYFARMTTLIAALAGMITLLPSLKSDSKLIDFFGSIFKSGNSKGITISIIIGITLSIIASFFAYLARMVVIKKREKNEAIHGKGK